MTEPTRPAVRVLGRGRMGSALADALDGAGWNVDLVPGRGAHVAAAARDVSLVMLCVPDGAVAEVAAEVSASPPGASATEPGAVIAHTAGALTLGVLAPHARRAGLHPLVSVPAGPGGAASLRGAWMALAGDPLIDSVAQALHGRTFRVADERRAAYHAAAAISANHLVALMGQAERVAASADVPAEAMLDLAAGALDQVRERGPVEALTGPVARGDWATVAAHLDALPPDERPAYEALARQALRLASPTLRAATDQGSAPPWRS
ncbi:MAG: Rossmann-like and DUF2520 domain-containing protein [Microthrixaceae bacterium]